MAWLSVARSQETLPSGRMVEAGPCAFTGVAEDSLASGPLPQPSSKCLGLAGCAVSSVSLHRGTSGPVPPGWAHLPGGTSRSGHGGPTEEVPVLLLTAPIRQRTRVED